MNVRYGPTKSCKDYHFLLPLLQQVPTQTHVNNFEVSLHGLKQHRSVEYEHRLLFWRWEHNHWFWFDEIYKPFLIKTHGHIGCKGLFTRLENMNILTIYNLPISLGSDIFVWLVSLKVKKDKQKVC